MTEVLSFLLHDVGGNVIAAALIAGVGFGLEKTRTRLHRSRPAPPRTLLPQCGDDIGSAPDEPTA